MRWTKLDTTCIYFEEFINQLNLLYIYICLYLQQDKNYEMHDFLYSILVLFSLCTFDLCIFWAKKDSSSFYNFKFCHTIPQHRVGYQLVVLNLGASRLMGSLVLFKAFACLVVVFWSPWISLAERSHSSFAL
jgi:hypothetical protein